MNCKLFFYVLAYLIITFITIPLYASPLKEKSKNSDISNKNVGNPRSLSLNERGVAQIKDRHFILAEATFKEALQVDKGNISAAYNLASVYLINKKEAAAVALLNEYILKAPNDGSLYVRLGDAYFGMQQIDNALSAYNQAWKLDPDFEDLAAKLSTIYLLKNNSQEAEKMLEIASSKSPKDGKLAANLSSVYLANGKPEQAIAAAKKALQVKATKEVYVTLATAYEILKDYKNSLISFQRAADLGDTRQEIYKKIEGLRKVTS